MSHENIVLHSTKLWRQFLNQVADSHLALAEVTIIFNVLYFSLSFTQSHHMASQHSENSARVIWCVTIMLLLWCILFFMDLDKTWTQKTIILWQSNSNWSIRNFDSCVSHFISFFSKLQNLLLIITHLTAQSNNDDEKKVCGELLWDYSECDKPGWRIDLELHGCIFLVLWCGVALVVEVVGSGGVDDGRLLRGLVEPLTVHVHQEGQQTRAQEARHACSYQVKQSKAWKNETSQYYSNCQSANNCNMSSLPSTTCDFFWTNRNIVIPVSGIRMMASAHPSSLV